VPPWGGRRQYGGVVAQADEFGLLREAQVIALQRQPDGVEDRKRRHGEHDDNGRGAQQPAQPALGPRPLRQPRAASASGYLRLGGDDLGIGSHRLLALLCVPLTLAGRGPRPVRALTGSPTSTEALR